uniref:Reverse transcriptase domain-containing protein n=1 Tax=Strongyloides venezuelensis TaxID=75913 RepID=A0A0K0FC99_STRVS
MEQQFSQKFSELLSDTPGRVKVAVVKLKLKNYCKFVKVLSRDYSCIAAEEAINKKIDFFIKHKIFEPTLYTRACSPLILIVKDSTKPLNESNIRFVEGYNLVNKNFEVPEVRLLTVKKGYTSLPLKETSHDLCTISTHGGLMKVKRLPQGISPAPALFQAYMSTKIEEMLKIHSNKEKYDVCDSNFEILNMMDDAVVVTNDIITNWQVLKVVGQVL